MPAGYPAPVNWRCTPDDAGYLQRDGGVKLPVIHAGLSAPIAGAILAGLPVGVGPGAPRRP